MAANITRKNWVDKVSMVGFNPELSTIWILEGLLYYLHDLQDKEVLRSIPKKFQGHKGVVNEFVLNLARGDSMQAVESELG